MRTPPNIVLSRSKAFRNTRLEHHMVNIRPLPNRLGKTHGIDPSSEHIEEPLQDKPKEAYSVVHLLQSVEF